MNGCFTWFKYCQVVANKNNESLHHLHSSQIINHKDLDDNLCIFYPYKAHKAIAVFISLSNSWSDQYV